jgi:hypothetical protein
MPSAENAIIFYEAGQTAVAMGELADQGDRKAFKCPDPLWSGKAGYEPDVKPNGLATGGQVTPAASGSDDQVDVAAFTCYLAGVKTLVAAAANQAITRPLTNEFQIFSITVTAAGTIAVVVGDEGTAFSEDRGAAGGPPWIPTDSIEIAQVRVSSQTSAPIASSEIKQVVGTHCERYDFPTWTEQHSDVENGVLGNAGIVFDASLVAIHSDDAGTTTSAKKVFAAYFEPEFAQVPKSSDFVPPETSHSVSSTQVYGATLGSTSESLNQGSFNAYLEDGVGDGLLSQKNQNLWFKFRPNRLAAPYILCQGKLGISRTFPAGADIMAACTVSAQEAGVEVTG